VSEISHWRERLGAEDFAFYDDALLVGGEDLLSALTPLGLRFHCPNALHARYVSRQAARLMREAGFTTIRLGLESVDPVRQRETGGKVTGRECAEAIENLAQAGYDAGEIGVYILCGLPQQEASEVMDTIKFVRQAGARPMIVEYSPIPGTEMWSRALDSSGLPLDREPMLQNNTFLPCRWEGLTYADYEALRRECRSDSG
jgi:radical SAM superfamily enzyme YgiQ (UPF0313 family)